MTRKYGFLNGYFRKPGYLSDHKGIALVAGLALMVVLTVLSFVAIQYASVDIKRTKDYTKTRQAVHIAEAGIHRALNYFNYDASGNSPGEVSNGFDDELVGGADWPSATFTNISLGSGGGTYTVTIADNADGTATTTDADNSVILTSTGTISGVTATLEAVIYRPLFKSQYAILSDGDVKVAGNSTSISGTNGAIHTNSDFTQSGSGTISGGVTASGECDESTCTAENVAEEFVPVIEPSDYEQYADYIFNADGTVYQQGSTTDLCLKSGGGTCTAAFLGAFKFNSSGWSISGETIGTNLPDQVNLYFKDDFTATSIGSSGNPWTATVVTEKSIAWTGNAYVNNYKDSSDSVDIQNLFLVAGNDIKVSSMEQNTTGLIAAKDQVSLGGGATLEGYIIANDLTGDDNTVNSRITDASGGVTLVYNGDIVAPVLSNKVSLLSWQET